MFLDNLLEKEHFFSKYVVMRGNIVTGKDVFYKNKDFELSTKHAKYDKVSHVVDGGEFSLKGKNYIGYGKEFMIDGNKNIYASNIDFRLKVK